MSAALWLAWRELTSRRLRLALSVAVVSTAVALYAATELVSRGREAAIATQLDAIGPSLQVVPEGVSASALARYDLGERLLPPETAHRLRQAGLPLRALEGRLVIEGLVAGRIAPIIGVPGETHSPLTALRSLGQGEVALGSALAEATGAKRGAMISVGRERYRVAAVLPSTGSADDIAAHLPLAALAELCGLPGALNELRLYLNPGAAALSVEAALRLALPGTQVLRVDRGEVAERGAHDSLERHRRLAYLVTAVVVGLFLLIASHLDTAERRVELATLVAMGGSSRTVLLALLARAALVGALGAAMGFAVGVTVALAQDPGAAAAVTGGWRVGLEALAASMGLGLVAASPVALLAASREPVRDLQEG